MKLSKKTLAVLKNFAAINQSIVIKPGNKLETISNVKDMFANVEVDESFDKTIAIYDLNEFLGIVSLFEEPEFDFQDGAVLITEGNVSQRYQYADPSVITQVPEKGITLPSTEVTVKLTKEILGKLVRAASLNNASDLTFSNDGIFVHDKAVPGSNKFSVDVGNSDGTYSLSISVDKLKMVQDDYNVAICAKGLAQFVGDQGITYYVALQPDGQYVAA